MGKPPVLRIMRWNTFAFPGIGLTINATFFDGSAHSVRLRDLWSLQWHRQWDTTAWQSGETQVQFPHWLPIPTKAIGFHHFSP